MGSYVNVVAKQGCEDQINALWAGAFPGVTQLISTRAWIESQIAFVQASDDPNLAYQKTWLHTVNDWNSRFPIFAEGRGQIYFGATGVELDENEVELLSRRVQFVLDNRMLFSEVTGLADAREDLEMDIPFDEIRDGGPFWESGLDFSELPVQGKSDVYWLCVDSDRPDLWEAFCAFRDNPGSEAWERIKNGIVPWDESLRTVWQLCEQAASERDGTDFGLFGRFRDGVFPTEFELERALRSPDLISDTRGTNHPR